MNDELDNDSDAEIDESDFDWLANVYTRQGAMNHPSELHGLMLGEFAGGLQRTAGDWLQQVREHLGVEELNSEVQANVAEDLIAFYQRNLDGIDKDSSSFIPVLPDDDYELSERLDALAHWVRGFLGGIAMSASPKLKQCSQDIREILEDFVEISQLDPRVETNEEGEREFFEVADYVRIGVLNIYAELTQVDSSNMDESSKPTIH